MTMIPMSFVKQTRAPDLIGRQPGASLFARGTAASAGEERHLPASVLPPVQRLAMTLPNGDAADVHLPRGAAPDCFGDALPVVAFLQGAFVDKADYSEVAGLIAAQGFVVVVPNHARTLPPFPQPVLFAEVDTVNAVYDATAAANADPDSPLYRIVDTGHMGLVGHSLGGAIGLYAIAGLCQPGIGSSDPATYRPPAALKAAAVYGTNLIDRRSGEFRGVDTSAAAVAMLQGSLDGIATMDKARQSYEALARPRALVVIEGANHYSICNRNNPPGAEQDPAEPGLPPDQGHDLIAHWTGLWLRAELLGDETARSGFATGGGAPDGAVKVLAAAR